MHPLPSIFVGYYNDENIHRWKILHMKSATQKVPQLGVVH